MIGINMANLYGLLYALACCLALTAASTDEKRLLQSILKDSDTAARPVLNAWEVVNVTLRMWMLHVLRLELVGENLTMATKYRLRWNVPFMTWNPEDHGNVTSLHVQPTRIWTPDLILENNLLKEKLKNGKLRDSLLADTPVVVTSDGMAEWRLPTITKAHCKIDAMYFPFDRQKCTMNFTLLSHTVKEVRLLPESTNALTLNDADTHESGVWQVDAGPVKQGHVVLGIGSDPHPQLTMTLVLERKPLFFTFYIIYPAVATMAVSVLSLFLPNKSGEKMIFSVSILVAMNFFQQNLLKISFPTGEGIPLLGQLFGAGLAMSAVAVACGVLALRLHYKGSSEPGNMPDPSLMKHLARVTCMQGAVEELISSEPILIRKSQRNDIDKEDNLTINQISTVSTGRILQNDIDSCRKRINPSYLSHTQNHRSMLSSIVTQVTELKDIYQTNAKSKEVADDTRSAWELVALMVQRIMAVVCGVVLVAVCSGIFLQLNTRTN